MRAIFVSYRRNDSEGEAGRLFADLVKHFGEASVFMDVAAIDIGRDFRKAIDESVAECGVLLAIIGSNWIDARNDEGQRRLDDPSDFVRLETASALKRDIPVIPVLVRGAKMPRADQLPDDLKELAFRNCVELTHARWGTDLYALLEGLRRELNRGAKPPMAWWKSRTAIFALVAIAIVAAVVTAYTARPKQATVPDAAGGTTAGAASKIEPPATVEVPNLLGMSLRNAEQALPEHRLKLGNISRQPRPDVARNIVLNEFPKPGEKAGVGSAVDLEVSAGAPSVAVDSKKAPPPSVMVEVPPLAGQSLQAAEQTLLGRQLKLGNISRQPRLDVAKDTVLDEFPRPGEKVDVGSTVDLVMSAEVPAVPKVSPASVSVTISRATCSVAGPGTFRIEMAGRASVPVGQKCLFYAEASGPGGGTRWRPDCSSWGAASPGDGALWNVSCVHRPNDPSETAWQSTTIVKLQNGPPASVYAGVISDQKKAGGATRPLSCGP